MNNLLQIGSVLMDPSEQGKPRPFWARFKDWMFFSRASIGLVTECVSEKNFPKPGFVKVIRVAYNPFTDQVKAKRYVNKYLVDLIWVSASSWDKGLDVLFWFDYPDFDARIPEVENPDSLYRGDFGDVRI